MRLLALLLILASGCKSDYVAKPPAPPHDNQLPDELVAALPKTDGGAPILMSVPAAAVPGLHLQLTFDSTLDDPLARWGECLSRVTACYRTNDGPIGGCVDKLERCADDHGGKQCCPPSCFDRYYALRKSGVGEDDSIDRSFVEGSCVTGFAEQLAGVSP